MTRRARRPSGPEFESEISQIHLSWQSLGFDPLIDHYRIHGVPGSVGAFDPTEDNVLGRTVYPQWSHSNLDPEGETWTYQVVAVTDAGLQGPPSRVRSAASTVSITVTGTELTRVGRFDARTLEFQYAPDAFAQIPISYPDATFLHDEGEDVSATWPYLLPGPGDAWAGSQHYRQHWTFELDAAPVAPMLALWLVDTTRLVSVLEITINGERIDDLPLPIGATAGSRSGDGTENLALVRSFHEFAVDAELFTAGSNAVEFSVGQGGWIAWDAIGLYET